MIYRSARLNSEYDLAAFDCGNEVLNAWLREQALRAERAGVCATTVWTIPGDLQVIGFYSIAPTLLRRDELPSRRTAAGYSSVPGYLLGRLALDRPLHGKRLGSQLLLDALELIVHAAERGGGRVIVVDAIDDAAIGFYEHHGFVRVGDSDRLVMKIASARQAIG